MPEAKELSIIIACHSKTPFFRETLDSFLNCREIFKDAELLICDDASPSGGDGDTAREYAAKYPDFIRCIKNDTNLGVSKSYQRLVSCALGRYIMPFDSDDIFVPFDVKSAIKELDEHPEWCANYGKKLLFSAQEGFTGISHGGTYSTFALLLDPRMTHIGMIIRASEFSGKRGYLLSDGTSCPVADDVCLWSCLCAEKEMHFRNEIRGFYRIHPGQETKSKGELFAAAYERIRDNFLSEHAEIAAKITPGNGFSLSNQDKLAAVAICGIKFIRSGNISEQLYYLDVASQILPDDYGVDEYRIKLLTGTGNNDAALKNSLAMLAAHSDDLYVKGVALNFACELTEKDNFITNKISTARRDALQKFFFMTESQQQLLQKTVDKAKTYLMHQ